MGNIFVFLDWSMTTNKLVENGVIQYEKLECLKAALKALKKKMNVSVQVIFVSGTSFSVAKENLNLILNALNDEDKSLFVGFAYEYGSELVSSSGEIKNVYNCKLSRQVTKKLDEICLQFGLKRNNEIENYYNLEFEEIDENVMNFYKSCKKQFLRHDISLYDDEFGHGIDIKDYKLNKARFVSSYVISSKSNPKLIIVGGDSAHDEKMASALTSIKTIFIGFGDKEIISENKILSAKTNIDGIIDCIEKLSSSRLF